MIGVTALVVAAWDGIAEGVKEGAKNATEEILRVPKDKTQTDQERTPIEELLRPGRESEKQPENQLEQKRYTLYVMELGPDDAQRIHGEMRMLIENSDQKMPIVYPIDI